MYETKLHKVDGIKYPFWTNTPDNFKNIFFWLNGSQFYEGEDLIKSTNKFLRSYMNDVLPKDWLVVSPCLPRVKNDDRYDIYRNVDSQVLLRNTIIDDLILHDFDYYNRADLEIIKIFEFLKNEYRLNIEKFSIGGVSAGGSFSTLFSVLHPIYVERQLNLLGSVPFLPIDTIDGIMLNYPFGTCDFKNISNIHFDIDEYKKIKLFFYWGEEETNDDGYLNHIALGNQGLVDEINSIFGRSPVEISKFVSDWYLKNGFNIEIEVGLGLGHELSDKLLNRVEYLLKL